MSVVGRSVVGRSVVGWSGVGTFETNTKNLSDTSVCGAEFVADPLLDELANNGGPGAATLPSFTHAVRPGQPAENRGSCSISFSGGPFDISNTITTDQRGGARTVGQCDIGAFELGATITIPADPRFTASPPPGPLPMTGTTGGTVSSEIAVMNAGGASTLLDVTLISIAPRYSVSGLPIDDLGSGETSSISVHAATVPAGPTQAVPSGHVGMIVGRRGIHDAQSRDPLDA